MNGYTIEIVPAGDLAPGDVVVMNGQDLVVREVRYESSGLGYGRVHIRFIYCYGVNVYGVNAPFDRIAQGTQYFNAVRPVVNPAAEF